MPFEEDDTILLLGEGAWSDKLYDCSSTVDTCLLPLL